MTAPASPAAAPGEGRAKGAVTVETLARRMTATLARKPRNKQQRAFMASLPRRDAPVVSPADYVITRADAREAGLQAERDAQRLKAWKDRGCPPSPSAPPNRRLRPRAVIERAQRPLLERIVEVQQGRCLLCGTEIDMDAIFPAHDLRRPSFDHVMPKSLGGGNEGNYLIAHRKCNSDKSNRRPTGCELVWLAAVNAHLQEDSRP